VSGPLPLLPVGVRLDSLRLPFKRALKMAAQLGADAVEINGRDHVRPSALSGTGLRQLRKMLEDLRLKVAAVAFPTRRGYHVADDLERRIQATKAAMDMAYALGARVVTNHVGYVAPVEGTESEAIADPSQSILREALMDIGRHGQHCGAFLAARTGGEEASTMVRLIESLPAGFLTVDFDPGNFIVNGFSASEALTELAPHVLHVHARDGVRDLARGRGLEVPLGQGTVDWCELLAVLEQQRYSGYLTVERTESGNVVAEVGDAVAYLREIQR